MGQVAVQKQIREALARANPTFFNLYAITAAFLTYFCMYAFRKPFTVAHFEGHVDVPILGAIDYKIVLLISQVFGYTLSKFLGIKIVSESSKDRRASIIILMIMMAELALIAFAIFN